MSFGHPLVSIIMPAYNARETIGEAIESALAQTHRPIEVVVVDDGSSDGTSGWVEQRFGASVRLIHGQHRGRAAARNRGLKEAKGSLVQFLDADDLLAHTKVEQQAGYLVEHPDIAVVYGDIEYFSAADPGNTWRPNRRVEASGDVLSLMVDDGFVTTVSALVRADWCRRVGGFDEALISNEDWDLWLRLAAAGAQFVYHPSGTVVGSYRIGPQTAYAHEPAVHLLMGVRVLEKLERSLDPERARDLRVRRAIGLWRFGYGRSALVAGARCVGVREMLAGLLSDRRSFDYKLAWIVAGGSLGGTRASRLIEWCRVHLRRRTGNRTAR